MARMSVRRSALPACAGPARIIAAAGLAASMGASASGALIVSTWAGAQSGAWNTAALWTPNTNFPNNGTPAGDTYHAVISAVGTDYTVTLASAVTLDMLTLNSGNALLNHTSSAFNPGAASISAGIYRLSGGSVTGGIWTISGTGRFEAAAHSNNSIANAVINGDLLLSTASARTRVSGSTRFGTARLSNSSTSLGFGPGYTLLDDVIAEGAAGGTRFLEMNGSAGTFTIGASGSVTHAAGAAGDLHIGDGNWFGGAMTLVNNGLIDMAATGRTLSIEPDGGFTNSGTLRIATGTVTVAGGGWSNATGAVEMTGGVLNLGAFNIISGIGSWNRTGGTVNINGAINNTANTFTLDGDTTGSWTLNGGSVTGGSVNFADGAQLLVAANTSNLLADVDLNGDLILSTASARTRINGTTRFNTARLSNSSASLGLAAGYTLLDDVVSEGAAGGTRFLEMNGTTGLFTIDAAGSVTHASGSGGDLNIGDSNWFGGSMTLINNGLIEMAATGRTLSIQPVGGFTNNGTIRIANGTVAVAGGGWSNAIGLVEMTGGALNLGAFDITSGIGFWSRTGGTVNINGALNNAANSFTLDGNTTGSWTLNGGSINGGSVNFANGAQLLIAANSGNLLADVDLNGDLVLSTASARTRINGTTRFNTARLSNSSASLGFGPGYTLLDDVIAEGAAGGTRFLEMNGTTGTFTIGANGSVTHASGSGGDLGIGDSNWFSGSMTLINDGLIEMAATGRTLSIAPVGGFTNNGTLRVSNGTVTVAGGGWTNANGEVEMTGGVLNLGAFNVTSGIGSWSRTGGTVNINGALNNAANSFTLDGNTTGSWTLSGGSINGGSVNFANGAQLLIAANSGNLLADVDLNGDLVLSTASARTRINGTTRFNTARLSNSSASLGLAPGYALLDDVVSEGAAGGTRFLEMNGTTGLFTIDAAGSVTHASGSGGDLNIGDSNWFGGSMTLINNGLIEMAATGRTLSIQPVGGFTNNGTLRVSNGTVAVAGGGWTNANGEVEMTAGVLNLGAFDVASGIGAWNRSGGTVNINGAINNAASTFSLNNSTGSWTLNGGSITGGAVNLNQSAQLLVAANSSNLLADVDVNGDLILSTASARTRVNGATRFNTARLSGSSTSLGFAPGYTLLDDIVAEGASGSTRFLEMNNAAGVFTIGAAGSVTHAAGAGGDLHIGDSNWFTGGMTLVNEGDILAEASGRTTSVEANAFTNNGTVRARNGGVLNIDVAGVTAFANAGEIIAGPGGTVRFTDGYDAAASSGDLIVQLGGALAANYGRINITAATTLDGSDIDVEYVNGFSADWGDKFTILTFGAGLVTGDFSSFVLPVLTDAVNWRWYTETTSTSVAVGVRHTADVNRDNQINFSDLNIIVSNFNTNGSATMGDVNEDGFIGFADLNRVVSFFNTAAPVNTVPAPAAALMLAGLAGAAARRRR